MNLPNLISLARLLSVPVTIWLMLEGRHLTAFLVFLLAGVSDAVDGVLARRMNARSVLGAYLDPLADKALLVSVYVVLGYQGLLPSWLVILVVSRDVMIIGGSLLLLILTDSFEVDPLIISKINTVMQIVLASVVLCTVGLPLQDYGAIDLLLYVVAVTTLASGAAYLVTWWRRLITALEDSP
ncbi:MAG: CDP-alcohol phosphatidyltransferase family protein [Alphaproteobacteria bacterium]|nr:CDP-alcohol phosphatidyltransferase family protein [Alphaproteobacteria bacterium]